MAWSLSLHEFRQPVLADALLLAAGKALYLANSFESKCRYILRIMNLVQVIESDPVLTLEQAISGLPQDKMLGATMNDIVTHPIGGASADLLHNARRARNLIAHEGTPAAPIWDLSRRSIIEHAARLRAAVADLAAGDNVVSTWCYEIEEKMPAPRDFKAAYPDMVTNWAFGDLDRLIAEGEGEPDDNPRTIVEYLRRRQASRNPAI
ncbi:hypothetical protein ACN27G_15110 [Plantactinospora sp. WMMB334]|uniref:hypothetical protein n=1 Tax=Plantactinospora sp. WMMB334 TaxID=3404119 RepID=UPI003B927DB6